MGLKLPLTSALGANILKCILGNIFVVILNMCHNLTLNAFVCCRN